MRVLLLGVVMGAGLFAQTAIEYAITAGKTAAIATGVAVAGKGTMDTALKKASSALEDAKLDGLGSKRLPSTDFSDSLKPFKGTSLQPARIKPMATSLKPSLPLSPISKSPVAGKLPRYFTIDPPREQKTPTVIDPETLRADMTRDELDNLGTPEMSISGADGETRIFRTEGGSVSVLVKGGKVEAIRR